MVKESSSDYRGYNPQAFDLGRAAKRERCLKLAGEMIDYWSRVKRMLENMPLEADLGPVCPKGVSGTKGNG